MSSEKIETLQAEIERHKYKAELYDEVWGLATGLGYMNVTTAIGELRKERDQLKARNAELESALKFYADREHYHFESGNWDTVSGEPLNILWCGDEPDFIEDGSVARNALSTPAGSEQS